MFAMAGQEISESNTKVSDVRFSAPPTEGLDANMGRLPVIEAAGESGALGQSTAINLFVAMKLGLAGTSAWETCQIVAMCEHLKEIMTAFRVLVPYGSDPTAEALDKWFDDASASDVAGTADSSKRSSRFLRWFVGRIEGLVGPNGFAVGSSPSLADAFIFNMFADSLTTEQTFTEMPAWRREPFASLERTNAILASHPKLSKIIATVGANAGVQRWMAGRGKQGF